MSGFERVDVGDGDFFPGQDVPHGGYYLDQSVFPIEAIIRVGATVVVEAGDGGCKDGVQDIVAWVVVERGVRIERRKRFRWWRRRRRDVKSVGGYDAVGQRYPRETTATGCIIFGLRREIEKCRAVGRWKRGDGGRLK